MPFWRGRWIWTETDVPKRNAFVGFRRRFEFEGGPAAFHITADSRYWLYVNGTWLGHGPVRAWPGHWRFDTYDLEPHLQRGGNVLAVLVQHFGEGTFQYIPGPPGLLAQLELAGATIVTSGQWRADPEPAYAAAAPRISVQEGFEEQFDARQASDWTGIDYNDRDWRPAACLRPARDEWHGDLAPRGIPFLTHEPVLPRRVVSREAVRSIPHRFTIHAKPYLAPDDRSSNHLYAHAYLATRIWSPADAEVAFRIPHKHPGPMKVNGQPVEGNTATLKAGWNSFVASLRRPHHLHEYVVALDGPPELRFSATEEDDGPPWAIVGPFGLNDDDQKAIDAHMDASLVVARPRSDAAVCERGEALWHSGDVSSVMDQYFYVYVQPEHLPAADAFVQAYTDRVVGADVRVEGEDGLVSGSEWTTVHPAPDGSDVRLLLDFGREVVGYHRFDIMAAEGTVLDVHNFEFIQPDGRHNLAEGMNNSFRYVCREGAQTYQTLVRRGFQYSYLILRNTAAPVRLRNVQALFASYPQARRGRFACSEAQLDRIWAVGAHSLRCCAEDTYTDCPTYEQTHWVGDARNEALIDWAINGDPRLWFRCLEQAGQSLERSPLTESNVPSAWQNILPAWSFLWMRSCREYLLFTGGRERARALLDFVRRNVEGVARHVNGDGLFEIRAWNMFDWAAMDTPSRGVVTHLNCMAVHALSDAAEMAEWLGEDALAADWRRMADGLAKAVNAHLWNDERAAYTDCLRDGRHSAVYSQQTQTVACMSGVAADERAARCRAILHAPPEGFVRAGSPFFEFFLLEAYQQEGRDQDFLDTIRRDWGFMVDQGATTFWELWSCRGERLTRSHCHGWSAAPTFFLSTHVLGVRPGGPGFAPIVVEPHPGDLAWCHGVVPTPAGDVEVQWENDPAAPFVLRVAAPEELGVILRLPREATTTLNGRTL